MGNFRSQDFHLQRNVSAIENVLDVNKAKLGLGAA